MIKDAFQFHLLVHALVGVLSLYREPLSTNKASCSDINFILLFFPMTILTTFCAFLPAVEDNDEETPDLFIFKSRKMQKPALSELYNKNELPSISSGDRDDWTNVRNAATEPFGLLFKNNLISVVCLRTFKLLRFY